MVVVIVFVVVAVTIVAVVIRAMASCLGRSWVHGSSCRDPLGSVGPVDD